MKKKKILVIGAGLSGLYVAMLLQEQYDVVVLEARDRAGGRIFSLGGHDMGPSWVWGHQKHILQLVKFLGLELFEQYTQGLALYDAPEGVQKFTAPPSAILYRVKGGMTAIVKALEQRLSVPVKLTEKVISINKIGMQLEVQTEKSRYLVDNVISTLPPRLAQNSIIYEPPLPLDLQAQLQNIPTWMGYATKCVIEYPEAFWREEGLSGFTFSHRGPLGEIHDACTEDKAALFGFVQSNVDYTNLKENIIKQLVRLYGERASLPSNIYVVDWREESYTSTILDAKPLNEHPTYGLDTTHFEDKMYFLGTETAYQEGGYLEGAIRAAREVKKHF